MNKQHNHYTRHSIRKQKDDDDDYGNMPPLLPIRCPETGQILPEPERKEFDLEGILQELEKDGSKVTQSALEKSQMASKGMTASHFQKCGRLETSFIDGLRSVGKFFTLPIPILVSTNNILTNLRYPSSLFIQNVMVRKPVQIF